MLYCYVFLSRQSRSNCFTKATFIKNSKYFLRFLGKSLRKAITFMGLDRGWTKSKKTRKEERRFAGGLWDETRSIFGGSNIHLNGITFVHVVLVAEKQGPCTCCMHLLCQSESML